MMCSECLSVTQRMRLTLISRTKSSPVSLRIIQSIFYAHISPVAPSLSLSNQFLLKEGLKYRRREGRSVTRSENEINSICVYFTFTCLFYKHNVEKYQNKVSITVDINRLLRVMNNWRHWRRGESVKNL